MKNSSPQFSIEHPCPVKWESMTPHEDGKYCGKCSKVVVDFAYKSNEEITDYLKKNQGNNICVSYSTDQLKQEVPAPRKRTFQTFLTALYFAFGGFLFSNSLKAQDTLKTHPVYVNDNEQNRMGGAPPIHEETYNYEKQGMTEYKSYGDSVITTTRAVLIGTKRTVYKETEYKWGVFYFKDNVQTTKEIYDTETSPEYVEELLKKNK